MAVEKSTKKQLGGATGKGFMPGKSGNPAGRPPGSISIVGRIKKKFEEDPEYFDEWLSKLLEDPQNRKAIMEQIDGKPKQPISGVDGQPIVVQIVKYGDNQPPV